MRFIAHNCYSIAIAITLVLFGICPSVAEDRLPNIVLILADDLGYGDLPAFFPKSIYRTPNIDRLVAQGTKYTAFYVSQPVCTASRASLMSGCYANRIGLAGALNHTSPEGINPEEELLPELLKAKGYATAIFGKWHLGMPPHFSPLKNGFDEWLGIPYSNDNSKYHPVLAAKMPPLPLYDGDKIVETDPDQSQFTRRFTERAVSFIERHQNKPFFLYMPQVMPHVPIFASDKFRGKSAGGPYGDVIEEMDWSVGQITATIDRLGLAENTLIIFTSDNGPFLSYGSHAGSAGPFRGGKLTTFEGGVRVPAIMRWKGRIKEGQVCNEPFMTIDLLPTFCKISNSTMPKQKIDGVDISRILFQEQLSPDKSHRPLFFYSGDELQAIRMGRWKLHFDHSFLVVNGETRTDGKPAGFDQLSPQSINNSSIDGIASRHGYKIEKLPVSLFDLENDPAESRNVVNDHPEITRQIKEIAAALRAQLGDRLMQVKGSEMRPAGMTP
jgi:arylsulfatase